MTAGNPNVAGNWEIKAYVWVYNQDPKLGGKTPFVTCETTFTLVNTGSGESLQTKLTGVSLMYDMKVTEAQSDFTMTAAGCGKISATVENDNFKGLTSFGAQNVKQTMFMDMSGNGGSGIAKFEMTNAQSDGAVMETGTSGSGKAQTRRVGVFALTNCTAGDVHPQGAQMCSQIAAQQEASMSKQQAAMMAFDDNKAAIQTANSTANLGVNTGDTIPQHCLNRAGNAKLYPFNYKLFDPTTGEVWVAPTPGGESCWYLTNSSLYDVNGKPWGSLEYPLWNAGYTALVNPQPVMRFCCMESGNNCWVQGTDVDVDGDGTTDGHFGANTITDATTVGNAQLGPHPWENSAGSSGNFLIKHEDTLVVPPSQAASQCSSLSLSALTPAPDTLNCGSASSPDVSQNGNKAFTVPSIPTANTYVDGVRVA